MDYSLKHLKGQSYYIPGRVNLGLYSAQEGAWLIDSGADESSGRAIYRLFQREGLSLKGIINTHSNADHVGGNEYLQKKTDCSIITTEKEALITRYPEIEPLLLWSAFPFKELRNKFLQAKPSSVTSCCSNNGMIGSTSLMAFPLPGHFIDMIGIRSPDDVCYIADSLFSEEIIEKYHLFFTYDVAATLRTLDFLDGLEAAWYVPCHAPASENIRDLIKINRQSILEIGGRILEGCSNTPLSREDILALLCSIYSIELNPTQYVLNLATVSAHITFLVENGSLEPIAREGRLYWITK